MRTKKISVGFMVLLCIGMFASLAGAQLTVTPDSLYINQNANAELTFSVTGGSTVNFMEFVLQVGDGGAAIGGTDTMPTIQSVDLITGCIFSDAIQTEVVKHPLVCRYSATNSPYDITATGKIATVTLDTSALNIGDTFTVQLSEIGEGYETYFNYSGTYIPTISGMFTMTVIPEPATMAILTIGCLSLAYRRKKY